MKLKIETSLIGYTKEQMEKLSSLGFVFNPIELDCMTYFSPVDMEMEFDSAENLLLFMNKIALPFRVFVEGEDVFCLRIDDRDV